MNESDRLEVFKAQTENVRTLEQAWVHLNRTINQALVNNQITTADIHTKLLAQVYCAYAEAVFSKLIHTPYGLTLEEIRQTKSAASSSIVNGWKKCIDLSLRKVAGRNSNHVPNTKQKLYSLIALYVEDPSILRNKIAHGQWKIALNRNNTQVNSAITQRVSNANSVNLFKLKKAFESLYRILEDIIESPNKAHHRDYWCHIVSFEENQLKMLPWTLEAKIQKLQFKKNLSSKD